MRSFRRRAAGLWVLGASLVWGALPACNLVVGGEDKILVAAGESGGAGAGAAGGNTSLKGGASGAGSSGGAGSAGGVQGGAAGVAGTKNSAGAGGNGAMGGGAGSGSAGAAGGGAGGSAPVYLKPGSVDCDAAPVQGIHRFCTDFAPLPNGWAGAGCSVASAEEGNVFWRWEQNLGSTCGSFVNIALGTAHATATMSMWLRVDALSLGEDKLAVMHVRIGDTTRGEIALRVERDNGGAVAGTSLIVQTTQTPPEVKIIGAIALGDWRHVRLRVAADGTVRGTFGATTGDTISSVEVKTTSTPAGPPYVELPFRQTVAGTGPTRISIDELTVDVTN